MSARKPTHVDGVMATGNGQVVFGGHAARYRVELDSAVIRFADSLNAEHLEFPTFVSAEDLERVDYFGSFPHHATFPVTLAEDGLADFAAGNSVDSSGAVSLTELAPVRDVLTPAACYHLYAHHQGQQLIDTSYFTFRCTCFRKEAEYVPLERQWSFSMREVVTVGTPDAARAFTDLAQPMATRLAAALGIPVEWKQASDPFFRPSSNPKYLMQQIDPTKWELTFDDRLAIASVNFHHDHFGRAFDMNIGGAPATTACLAFGWERWISALGHVHGPDPQQWPDVAP